MISCPTCGGYQIIRDPNLRFIYWCISCDQFLYNFEDSTY